MKISVITPTYNSEATLVDCIESVHNQLVKPEHIIIDGVSTDKTLQILDEHKDKISRVISEPDKGIYDALNKGLSIAETEIVGCLNSDDFYSSHFILERVMEVFHNPKIDACYGDLVYVDKRQINKIIRHWKAGHFHPEKFYYGWMPPHPTFFVRKSVYEKLGGFNLLLGTAADYELMLRFLFKHRINVAYIPEVIVHMRTGGASNTSLRKRLEAHRMDYRSWLVNNLQPKIWTIPMKPIRKLPQWVIKHRS